MCLHNIIVIDYPLPIRLESRLSRSTGDRTGVAGKLQDGFSLFDDILIPLMRYLLARTQGSGDSLPYDIRVGQIRLLGCRANQFR